MKDIDKDIGFGVSWIRRYPILWVFFNFEENFQEEKLNRSQNLFFFPKRYICFEQIFFFFHNEPPYGLFETD